ncbi:MAG TPA: hypothetical protein VFU04_02845 [Solirubrobacterales bacterium]|nr:hypothetical protein [Solirubrobacterales bacterium]
MRPGNRETIPTVSEVVRDAAAICDPDGSETAVTALFESFEDDDRPATASEDLAGELLETVRAIDGEGDDPAALAAAAAATWLATNPGQADNGDHVLREGTRLAFEGQPPKPLAEWLSARGVEI